MKMAEEGVTSVACLGVDFMAESVRATLDSKGFQGVPVSLRNFFFLLFLQFFFVISFYTLVFCDFLFVFCFVATILSAFMWPGYTGAPRRVFAAVEEFFFVILPDVL